MQAVLELVTSGSRRRPGRVPGGMATLGHPRGAGITGRDAGPAMTTRNDRAERRHRSRNGDDVLLAVAAPRTVPACSRLLASPGGFVRRAAFAGRRNRGAGEHGWAVVTEGTAASTLDAKLGADPARMTLRRIAL